MGPRPHAGLKEDRKHTAGCSVGSALSRGLEAPFALVVQCNRPVWVKSIAAARLAPKGPFGQHPKGLSLGGNVGSTVEKPYIYHWFSDRR
jgi:hypothetical protein